MTKAPDLAEPNEGNVPQSAPGTFARPSGSPMLGRPEMRRKVDASAIASLALGLPWFLFSLALVSGLASIPDSEAWTWVIVAAWLLSGAVMLLRPTESAVVIIALRLRRPDAVERAKLDPVWAAVTQRAGIPPTAYSLWVQSSADLNAFATAGHTVAVTTRALDLPSAQLEAVLAHELGHHLGGHAWATGLAWWYSLPGRFVVRLTALAVRFVAWLYRIAWLLVNTFARQHLLLTLLIGVVMLCSGIWMLLSIGIVLLPLAWIPPTAAWFSRRGEKRADQVAADLDYGPALIEVLQILRADEMASEPPGRLARLLASHPSPGDRIGALYRHPKCAGRV